MKTSRTFSPAGTDTADELTRAEAPERKAKVGQTFSLIEQFHF